jgi:hypothetical protein
MQCFTGVLFFSRTAVVLLELSAHRRQIPWAPQRYLWDSSSVDSTAAARPLAFQAARVGFGCGPRYPPCMMQKSSPFDLFHSVNILKSWHCFVL